MTRPKVRVFERKRINIAGARYMPGEGFYAEIGYEIEIKVGESENAAVSRALSELEAEIKRGQSAAGAESLEDRLRRLKGGA